MREIKFRAWDKEQKKFISPIIHDGKAYHNIEDFVDNVPWINHDSQQFTGLHDKHGKEIWEGDLVIAQIYDDDLEIPLVVKWEYSGFIIDYQDSESDFHYLETFPGSLEVIGNFCEHHELLEAK